VAVLERLDGDDPPGEGPIRSDYACQPSTTS
jgi:hypothetical protein